MKQLYLSSLVLLLMVASVRADAIDNVALLIKQGNVQKLSELFAPNVELTINGEENTYPKKQATDIITQFFNAHKLVSSKLLHKVNTGRKFVCGMVSYSGSNSYYRIAYTLDISNGTPKLIEIRIEPEKTK